ncbi:ATP-binding cassette domain-containing protein [Candidatus Saccharibacteria bacterium]|nr:ATP-binding cassette domain-containing protein [Candidatus Saccharibacteria bacterium]
MVYSDHSCNSNHRTAGCWCFIFQQEFKEFCGGSIVKKSKASDIALKIENVSKSFRLPTEKASGIKQAFINRMRGVKGYTKQQVLKDISFEVKKGDFFGIVGRNGSGKSTLLKLISQIYTPDSGKITVNGSLVPFIELGVGFNPELTGRENVYLNGAMLGFSKEEIDEMYDDIVDFAELHDFMDQKLKNYSSGMQVRLAFSVAIKAQGDILVLDEVLAVGDEAFQRKCEDFFGQVKRDKSKTVVLVTHSMGSVRKYCNKALMLDQGVIKTVGDPDEVASQYTLENFNTPNEVESVGDGGNSDRDNNLVPEFKIVPLSKQVLRSSDAFSFYITYKITADIPVRFGFSLIDDSSGGATSVFDDQVRDEKNKLITTSTKKGTYRFDYKIPLNRFNNRNFTLTATLSRVEGDSAHPIAITAGNKRTHFSVIGGAHDGGLLREKGQWINKDEHKNKK